MINTFRTKYDFKNEFTRKKIQDAFLILASEKPISRININEICSIAGVHRSTFYRHYDDIYDLLSLMEKELLVELRAVLEPFGKPGAIDENGYVKRKLLLRYFHVCSWHRQLILVLTEGNIENSFRSDFTEIITDALSPIYSGSTWAVPSLKQYVIRLTSDIILSMMIQWLKGNDLDYDEFTVFYEEVFRSNYNLTRKAMTLVL